MMGLAASSSSSSTRDGGDIIRRCNCYSMSLDRKCYRHSLTFSDSHGRSNKKKRSYGFATFKKKLIGKRRHHHHCKGSSGASDGRFFREHFADCSSVVLKSLLGQYEALTLLKDLSVQANLARPPAPTLRQGLNELLGASSCSDVVLVHGGHRFPAHRSLLMARCPYFARNLSGDASELHLEGVSLPSTVRMMLLYLYTGGADVLARITEEEPNFSLLREEFGVPNSLESDVAFLGETGSLSDCSLVFSTKNKNKRLELRCHRAVVAARSGFFQKLLEKRKDEEIHLDGNVIPAKYGCVLVHALYMDSLDLRLVDHGDNDAADAAAVHRHGFKPERNEDEAVDDAMNLYEIGRFLEFDFLSQCCEDLLMLAMASRNVVKMLRWSLEPQGSAWIARQAYQFLEEEFHGFASDPELLAGLDPDTLARILKSDFTQASESEILRALVRWGEQQLKCKDHEATGSSSSTLTRKSAKRRDGVCDSELKELLAPFFERVRIQHVLPRDRASDVVDMAVARNLFPFHPNFASQSSRAAKFAAWDPANATGYVRPRLFLPYFEECKNIIQERCAQDPELIISSSSPRPGDFAAGNQAGELLQSECSSLDYHTSRLPDVEMVSKMAARLEKLLNCVPVQRALSMPSLDREEILRLVELRVVRECNLPDSYTSLLHKMRGRYMTSIVQARQSVVKSAASSDSDRGFRTSNLSGKFQVPDVTLATSAFSGLSFGSTDEHGSPDLVADDRSSTTTTLMEGLVATKLFDDDDIPPAAGRKSPWRVAATTASSSVSGSWQRNVYSVVGAAKTSQKQPKTSSKRDRPSHL